MQTQTPVTVFIACSLDGFIAGPGDDLGFLSRVEKEGEDYGYSAFVETIDTVILGRKTYDKVMSFGIPFPHQERKTYVLTRTPREGADNLEFYSGDLKDLVMKLKASKAKGVFVDGGANVVNEMLNLDLVDELIISSIPVILGRGVRLFGDENNSSDWETVSTRMFEKGLVQTHWRRKRV